MRRREQLNDELRKELASAISKETILRDGMVTVIYVDCAPDLSTAKVGISVLPFDLGVTAIKKLIKKSGFFSGELKQSMRLRRIPKFHWVLDNTEENASKIEKILGEINEHETKDSD
jgi:ribosome-binding factor A